ncbi:uncharacterized protein J3R85_012883 [Psidium guajava]|nr:uncharacterized protein J3R85_012883 [Psidium guajava]
MDEDLENSYRHVRQDSYQLGGGEHNSLVGSTGDALAYDAGALVQKHRRLVRRSRGHVAPSPGCEAERRRRILRCDGAPMSLVTARRAIDSIPSPSLPASLYEKHCIENDGLFEFRRDRTPPPPLKNHYLGDREFTLAMLVIGRQGIHAVVCN